jgi:large subunit ribosomal protein L29
MKKDKLSALDPAEMRARLKEIEDQGFQLRFRMSMGQTEGLRKIREMRKDKARLLTYLRSKELQGAK